MVSGVATWHHGGRFSGRFYGGFYGNYWGGYGAYWRGWSPSWWWGWGGPWGFGWWGDWGPYTYYYDSPQYFGKVYPNDSYGNYGALDLDVSPEKAEVYVNGQKVGICDDYDGFPTYLWLEAGVYDVVFYLPGYETIARQYVIRPGQVIDVDDDMVRGQAIRPEDLPAKTHEHRDERLRQNKEVEDDAARGIKPHMPYGDEAWRDRVHPLDRPADGDQQPTHHVAIEDARVAPARLKLTVEPGDASVYLDGRFVGTAAELEQLDNGLLIDAGAHRLEAVRPGRRPMTKEFTAEPGGESTLSMTLEQP
jgi:hypothetical protein